MPPRCIAGIAVSAYREPRVAIELIVPNQVIVRPVINLVERGADRIGQGRADAILTWPQSGLFAAGVSELLSEALPCLHRSAKYAGALSGACATPGEGLR